MQGLAPGRPGGNVTGPTRGSCGAGGGDQLGLFPCAQHLGLAAGDAGVGPPLGIGAAGFGRVCKRQGTSRNARIMAMIRADICQHGDDRDLADLDAADAELRQRRSRKGIRAAGPVSSLGRNRPVRRPAPGPDHPPGAQYLGFGVATFGQGGTPSDRAPGSAEGPAGGAGPSA